MSLESEVNRRKTKITFPDWLANHWLGIFLTVYGLWVGIPWLAPTFMHIGWEAAGRALYSIYSIFCHQLPERSFFFYGQKSMYSLTEIQAVWQNTSDPAILRNFIGNSAMGWKMAWSDRMISFYSSIWIFVAIWIPFRRKVKILAWWGFILLLLPILLDGGTHMFSDIAGIGLGFRDNNLWLASLTNGIFPDSFYVGDALGSFNSWMRLITGPLAGLAIVRLVFPYIFQATKYKEELDRLNYAQVIEQIRTQNQDSSG